jgi:hypothetical protein
LRGRINGKGGEIARKVPRRTGQIGAENVAGSFFSFIFNGLSILFFYGALMAFLKQRQFFRAAKKAANEGTVTGKEASRGGGLGKKK